VRYENVSKPAKKLNGKVLLQVVEYITKEEYARKRSLDDETE